MVEGAGFAPGRRIITDERRRGEGRRFEDVFARSDCVGPRPSVHFAILQRMEFNTAWYGAGLIVLRAADQELELTLRQLIAERGIDREQGGVFPNLVEIQRAGAEQRFGLAEMGGAE